MHNGLTKPRGEPGCFYVPKGIEIRSRDLGIAQDGALGWIAKHLCAEQRRRDEETGGIVWEKVDGAGRHDYLDVTAYARALGLEHAERLIRRLNRPKSPRRYGEVGKIR